MPSSMHFELKEVAEGVYAAIGIPGGAAFSNAGIVDLGDQTMVFDTFQTPHAAQDLKDAAEALTGRTVSYVVISLVASTLFTLTIIPALFVLLRPRRRGTPSLAPELAVAGPGAMS